MVSLTLLRLSSIVYQSGFVNALCN